MDRPCLQIRSPRALSQLPSSVCRSHWECFSGQSARLCPHAANRWGQHRHMSHHKRPCANQKEGKLSLQTAPRLPGALGDTRTRSVLGRSACPHTVLSPPRAPNSPAPWPAPFSYANRRKRSGRDRWAPCVAPGRGGGMLRLLSAEAAGGSNRASLPSQDPLETLQCNE